jgi:hypothetical protein
MAAKKHTAPDTEITDILKVSTGSFECCLVGTSPLVLNRMSEKAKHELLMPKGKKTATEKALSLKHMPIDEYRASAYTLKDGPALLALMSTAFKGALRSAALDMPGAKKAQIGSYSLKADGPKPSTLNAWIALGPSSTSNRWMRSNASSKALRPRPILIAAAM